MNVKEGSTHANEKECLQFPLVKNYNESGVFRPVIQAGQDGSVNLFSVPINRLNDRQTGSIQQVKIRAVPVRKPGGQYAVAYETTTNDVWLNVNGIQTAILAPDSQFSIDSNHSIQLDPGSFLMMAPNGCGDLEIRQLPHRAMASRVLPKHSSNNPDFEPMIYSCGSCQILVAENAAAARDTTKIFFEYLLSKRMHDGDY